MEVALRNPEEFGRTFVEVYLGQGFQSLSKRDLDLLVFILLERDGAVNRADSNFDVARKLRITPAKVRSLRRDAYARWRPLLGSSDPRQQLQAILASLLTQERLEAGHAYASNHNKAAGYIAIRLEHPDDRELLEQALREAGEYPVYERNPEVIVVSLGSLLAVAARYEFVSDDASKFYAALKKAAEKSEDLQDLLTKDVATITWDEVRAVLNEVGARIIAKNIESVKISALLKLMFPFLA